MSARLLDENIIIRFIPTGSSELKLDPQATGGPSRQAQLQDECDIAWRGLRFGQRLWEAALLVSGEGSCA